MKKRFLNVAGMLAFGTALVLTSCSSDDGLVVSGNDGATDYEIANAQTLSVQVENTGDNMTRAGRPLYSSEAKQDINTVKVVIYKLNGVSLAENQTITQALANPAKLSAIEAAMVGNAKDIVAVKTFDNWMTDHVSEDYSTNGHGRLASWSLVKEDWIVPASDRDIYCAYAVGYNKEEYTTSLTTFNSLQKENTLNLPLSVEAATNEGVSEIFAGATYFNIETSSTKTEDGDVIYKFNSTLTLHRQVAGVFGYLTDIPVYGNAETDPDQNRAVKKLRLVSSQNNTNVVFSAFNSLFTENPDNDGAYNDGQTALTGNYVQYLVNGKTPGAADAKFYNSTTNDAYTVYEIDLAAWFPKGDVNGDGVLNEKDCDGDRDEDGAWVNIYDATNTKPKFKSGSVFGKSFIIPFMKAANVATFQLQALDDKGEIVRWWNIRIASNDVKDANAAGVFGLQASGVKNTAKNNVEETADSYSVVRNHLYTIGSKDKDDDIIDDEPQSLGQETLVIKVNDNWEMVHRFEVD